VDRPFISLKLATSLDGKIALSNGQSKWITSDAAREKGRTLRATHDAIAIGSNTAVLDNPKLTTRIEGAHDPVRVVYDSRLRLQPDSFLAQTAHNVPVIAFCGDLAESRHRVLKDKGIQVHQISQTSTGLDIQESLGVLIKQGVKSLLIEGGGTLAASFLGGGYVNEIHWFRAPIILGGDGRNWLDQIHMKSWSVIADVYGYNHRYW